MPIAHSRPSRTLSLVLAVALAVSLLTLPVSRASAGAGELGIAWGTPPYRTPLDEPNPEPDTPSWSISAGIDCVDTLDATRGWAVGRWQRDDLPVQGMVWATVDGGSSWATATVPELGLPPLNGLSVVAANKVWAAGNQGYIGFFDGSSWATQTTGVTSVLNAVDMYDATHGWAVGDAGTLLKLNGSSWVKATTPASLPAVDFRGVVALSATTAVAVGGASGPPYDGRIYRTADGGANWVKVGASTPNMLRAVGAAPDGVTLMAVGWDATVYRSTDAGLSWTLLPALPSPLGNHLYGVSLEDSRSAVAVGNYGALYSTRNAGRDWTFERARPDGYPSDVFDSGWPLTSVARWPGSPGQLSVSLYNDAGSSRAYIFPVTLSVATVPAAPTGLTVANVASQPQALALSWTDPSYSAAGFHVERAIGAGTFSQVASLPVGTTSWTDTGLTANAAFSYRVTAFNAVGDSSPSNVATGATVPSAPTGLGAAAAGTTITVTWSHSSAVESGFRIYRSLSSGSGYVQVGTAPANATSFANGGLASETEYFYKVAAYNGAGESTAGPVSATTPVPPVEPTGTFTLSPSVLTSGPVIVDASGIVGAETMSFTFGGTDVATRTFDTPYALNLRSAPDGTRTIEGTFSNTVGTFPFSRVIVLDTQPPAGSVTIDGGASATNSPTMTLSLAATDLHGPIQVSWDLNEGAGFTQWTTLTPSAQVAFSATPGTKTVFVRYRDAAGNESSSFSDSIQYSVVSGNVTPFAGADRYQTTQFMAQRAYPDWSAVRNVVIASGENRSMADPLSAAGLCYAYDAPLLLVHDRLINGNLGAAQTMIEAIHAPVNVYIVGGPAAVPSAVVKKLRSINHGGIVEQFSGANRYGTAELVFYRMRARKGSAPDNVLIANGWTTAGYFDALSLSTITRAKGYPLLLVRGTDAPGETRRALEGYPRTQIWAAGNYTNIPKGVLGNDPAGLFAGEGQRVPGTASADRFGTAVAVANWAVGRGWLSWSNVAVGNTLPDALAGGAFVGDPDRGGPMLYTDLNSLNSQTEKALIDNKASIEDVWVLGGTAAVSQPVRDLIYTRLH